jgi:HNH endonuclease
LGSSSAASGSSGLLARNQTAKALAEQRDGFHCVLTGHPKRICEVAHIYPFYSLKKREEIFGPRYNFWEHLKNFWPEEKVTTWEAEIFLSGVNEIGVDRIYNLITLASYVHSAWNRGAFALKPVFVSNDNTTLTVQFFWQKPLEGTRVASLLTRPPSTEGLTDSDGLQFRHKVRDTLLRSGEIFELHTDDPISKPLPSFKLLEMQWFLQRVVGMAAAAGPYEPDWGDDSDEDISSLGLDEVGDKLGDDSNLGLGEVEDESFMSGSSLPASPPALHKGILPSIEGSKHYMSEAEDRVEDSYV